MANGSILVEYLDEGAAIVLETQDPDSPAVEVFENTPLLVQSLDTTIVEDYFATTGPPGPKGDIGVATGPTPPPAPTDTMLWVDTSADAEGIQEIFVQPDDPGMTSPGVWFQTGLGDDGTGVTIWIEDGT